jgi:4-hydroxy-tetrahydrodipicolinate synthase
MAALSRPWREAGDGIRFRDNYLDLLPLLHYTYSAVNPVAVKSLMKAIGLPSGDLRRPLTALSGTALDKGLAVVRDMGLAARYGLKAGASAGMAAE